MTNEPYLWDKSDPQDAFVAKLERFLTPRRDKVRHAGRPGGPRALRLVGSVVMAAAAAAVMVWVCFGRGADGTATVPGSDEVAPQVETVPASADPDADAALEEAVDVEKKAADDGRERGLGAPSLDPGIPATIR